MNLDRNDKNVLSGIRMAKAQEFLADARANFTEGRYRSSVNRSYYAALSAVRSLLALEGVHPESHEGVVTLLSLKFVKTGMVPVEVIKRFKVLLSRRTDVDYGDFDSIDVADAEDSLQSAERIIVAIETARRPLLT